MLYPVHTREQSLISSQKMVPALIESVKVASLVLASDTSGEPESPSRSERGYAMPDGIDGLLKGNGVLRFNETIDM